MHSLEAACYSVDYSLDEIIPISDIFGKHYLNLRIIQTMLPYMALLEPPAVIVTVLF